jgi:hypothetical protein
VYIYACCYSFCHVEGTCESIGSIIKRHVDGRESLLPENLEKEVKIHWQFPCVGENDDKILKEAVTNFLKEHTPTPESERR